MVNVPNYSNEEPMLYIISLTEFVLVSSLMFLGMMFNLHLYAIAASFFVVKLYRKYSEDAMPGQPIHKLYEAGILMPNSRIFPPAMVREVYR